jgi:hypothetical protein
MGNIIPVPTLSANAWVKDPNGKIDFLLAHFYESEKSQTAVYGDNVASLQYIVQKYGSDITALVNNIKLGLEKYLARYYDTVVVEVTSDDTSANITGAINLKLYCEVSENGITNSVGNLLKTNSSKITSFTKLNNG